MFIKANKRKFELLEDVEPDRGFGNEESSTAKSLGMVKIRGMLFFLESHEIFFYFGFVCK